MLTAFHCKSSYIPSSHSCSGEFWCRVGFFLFENGISYLKEMNCGRLSEKLWIGFRFICSGEIK